MPEYCEVALPVPLDQSFTYAVPQNAAISPGMRVIVPFGARQLTGIVLRCGPPPEGLDAAAIKPIRSILDEEPTLSPELLRLGRWLARYYQVPEGETLAAMLPPQPSVRRKTTVVLTPEGQRALLSTDSTDATKLVPAADAIPEQDLKLLSRLTKRGGIRSESLRSVVSVVERLRRRGWIAFERTIESSSRKHSPAEWEQDDAPAQLAVPFELTAPQKHALDSIQRQMESAEFGVVLIHGVTGSGKTEIYLRAMEVALRRGGSALMLVPEIALTPAMAEVFVERFGSRVAVMHSGLTDREREAQWQRVRERRSDIVLGTRSAVFAPLDRLGLVIVDEEHDGSYKQGEAPRYNGRDVAIIRARDADATVVLGSATPSVETRYNAERGKYQLIEIETRIQDRPLPETTVVDMRDEFAQAGRPRFISRLLEESLARRLEQREQSLILLNRRGYSAFVLCRSCGRTIECENCSIALTHHRRLPRLLCHYCGFERAIPKFCPECASEHLYFVGEGSERIEDALHRQFPEARIARLDRDTARGRGQAEAILGAFRHHELDVLVGTQMIAKGHDIHRVTLVGIVSADVGLGRPDFRAAERTFQLLTQVAGRAGRGALPGEVVLQTYYPEHYAIRAAAAQDYAQFYQHELRFRKLMHYPPFTVLANVLVKSPSAETAMKLAGRLGRFFEDWEKSGERSAEHSGNDSGRRAEEGPNIPRERGGATANASLSEQPGLRVLGPAAALVYRLKKDYRYQFLLKASSRRALREVLVACRDFVRRENFPATSLIIDVDPQSLA